MPTHVVPIPILVVLQWRVVIISHYIVDHHASVCPFDATVLFACGITVETLCYGTGSSTAIVICPQGWMCGKRITCATCWVFVRRPEKNSLINSQEFNRVHLHQLFECLPLLKSWPISMGHYSPISMDHYSLWCEKSYNNNPHLFSPS